MGPKRNVHVILLNMALLALTFMMVDVATASANKPQLIRRLKEIAESNDDSYYTSGNKPANSYSRSGNSYLTSDNGDSPKSENGAYSKVGNSPYPNGASAKGENGVYYRVGNSAYPRTDKDAFKGDDNDASFKGNDGAYSNVANAYLRGDGFRRGENGPYNSRNENNAYIPRGENAVYNPRGENGAYNPRGEIDSYNWGERWSGYEGGSAKGYSGAYNTKDDNDEDNDVYDKDDKNGRSVFSVENYGASGNGDDDDTEAFIKAWDAACKASGATFLVPEGKTYFVNNIMFEGPCHSGLTVQVDGTIAAPKSMNSWKQTDVWIQFWKIEGLKVQGSGTFDGRGQPWWATRGGKKPTAVHFEAVNGLDLSGVTFLNSPQYHLTLSNSNGIKLSSLKIIAPEDSPNTDGIKTSQCKDVLIENTQIGTGDDCIALIGGSTNININDVTCGPGHGISVGSLGRENAEDHVTGVHVNGATLRGTQNGLRIKTWQGGRGVASDIIFENVVMDNVGNPLIIDQFYCPSASCSNQTNNVQVQDITFRNVKGTTATPVAIKLACSKSVPCKDITIQNVILTRPSGVNTEFVAPIAFCENASGQAIGTVVPSGCLPK